MLSTYKAKITALTLVPSSGGRFEVSCDGDLVYSKLETKKFPQWEQIKELVDGRLSA